MTGISDPYLSQIEGGLRDPSEKVLDALASNLELSADALYEQAGEYRAVSAARPMMTRPWSRRSALIYG